MLVFTLLFLAVPLLVLLAVWLTGAGLGIAMLGLVLIMTGFLVAIPMFEADRAERPAR